MDNQDSETTEQLRAHVHESRSRVVKTLLIAVGFISVVLGVAGVVLPIVPTTPFLLLAAACFANSSERFYVWLLTNPVFGSYIRDWRENRGLTIALKLWVIFVLVVTMGISIVFFIPVTAVKILLLAIGTAISIYILQLPTKAGDYTPDNVDNQE